MSEERSATPPADMAGDTADVEERGFVIVTRPLVSLSQFNDWVLRECLPSAAHVMRGSLGRDDTLELTVDRRSFLRDAARTFLGDRSSHLGLDAGPLEGSVSMTSTALPADAWERLLLQFQRDLPRELFFVDGVRYTDADAAFAAIQAFVKTHVGDAGDPARPDAEDSADASMSASGGSWILWALTLGLAGHGQPCPQISPKASAEQRATQLLVLLSQQSVMAFPLELIQKQFCEDAASELFVGDVNRQHVPAASELGDEMHMGMRVELTSAGRMSEAAQRAIIDEAVAQGLPPCGGSAPARLELRKVFRVFGLHPETGGDYTLFLLRVTMSLDPFHRDSPIHLTWSAVQAAQPAHTPGAVRLARDMAPSPRRCDCLGASSGYHAKTCTFARGAAVGQ